MIEECLRQIDELLSINPSVRDVEIVRRSVRDTDIEKVLNYRYRIILAKTTSPIHARSDVSPRGAAPVCDKKKSLRSPAWPQSRRLLVALEVRLHLIKQPVEEKARESLIVGDALVNLEVGVDHVL